LFPIKVKSLDDEVEGGGVNFSVGERQLLCVARALLAKAAIVCVDEATAAIDATTEATISALLETRFAGVTMIIIAHHLSTLRRCSRIVVLDAGSIVESGPPAPLLRNPASYFAQLANAS
jgi:ABC-type multidrug transport system fused ATPase/permease subunit